MRVKSYLPQTSRQLKSDSENLVFLEEKNLYLEALKSCSLIAVYWYDKLIPSTGERIKDGDVKAACCCCCSVGDSSGTCWVVVGSWLNKNKKILQLLHPKGINAVNIDNCKNTNQY